MALLHSPRIVTDGLVLCLDAANRESYPGSGTVWTDLAGTNNGNLENTPTFNSANGGSIVFDGSNEFAKINNNQVANNLSSMTVSVWVNTAWVNQTSQFQPIITKISDVVRGVGWDMGYVGGNTPRSFYFFTQNAGGSIYKYFKTNSLNLVNNTWINVTASYTNNFADILIYINGGRQTGINQSTAGTITSISTTSSVTIATRDGVNTLGTNFASLRLSNACIYNRVLTPAEIQQNYNATKGRYNL